ncbi:MAG: OmpH family outer membrane protein [SAR324 cluster bacterium]|nr:OmpH family outer membrane protein [SAR324 cluster bacterium]
MKKVFLLALCLTMVLTANLTAADLNIAVVDFNLAIAQSKEGKRSKKFLESQAKAAGEELKKKEKKLYQLDKELRESMMLSPEAKQQKMKTLQRLGQEFQKEKQIAQKKFQQDQNKHMQKILGDLRTIVEQVSKKGKYDIVLERQLTQGIVYTSLKFANITPDVVKAYDKSQ